MLAYAPSNTAAARAGSPKALALIIAGHAALLAAAMTAKMDVGGVVSFDPIDIVDIPIPPAPPEAQPQPTEKPAIRQDEFIENVSPTILMDSSAPNLVPDHAATIDDIATVIGTDLTLTPADPPKNSPMLAGPRLNTPAEALKPPYPNDKLRAEEEATLRLRLTIDARGRVTEVEPVGPADSSFLEAARRHIIRAWRYKPATEDGVAISSSTVISLSFRLEEG